MLIAYYSTLIIFLILFIFTLSYLVSLIIRKMATGGNLIALFFLLLIDRIVSGIYGFDFLKLQDGDVQIAQGIVLLSLMMMEIVLQRLQLK